MDISHAFDFILNPDAFFSRRVKEKPSLVLPFLVVGIAAISEPVTCDILGRMGMYGILRLLLFSGNPLLMIILPFCVWFLLSIFLYIPGRWTSKQGSFSVTLQNTGYCLVPFTLLTLVYDISALTIMPGMLRHFQEGGQFMLFMFLLVIVCFFWTAYLLVFGIKSAHSLSLSQAFSVAVIGLILFAATFIALEFANIEYQVINSAGQLTD